MSWFWRSGTRLLSAPLLHPLRGMPFRRLFLGEALVVLADQAFLVALTWLALDIAGPGLELGAILAVAAAPGAILTPLGGVLVDRFSPVPLMIAAGCGLAILLACLTALVLTDHVVLWHLYALSGLLGVCDALYYPSSFSVVPTLVKKERLEAANALVHGAEEVSGMLGPALAAGLVPVIGVGATFGVNAVMFSVATVLFLGVLRATRRHERRQDAESQASPDFAEQDEGNGVREAMIAGVRYAWSEPAIRVMFLVLVTTSVASIGPILVGGATLADERLGGAGAFGIMLSAFGAGSLVGALVAGSFGRPRRRGSAILSVTAALGVCMAVFGFAPNLVLTMALAGAFGAGSGWLGVVLVAWLQEEADPAFRGRVMSLIVFASIALDPLSYALAGILAESALWVPFVAAGGLLSATALLCAISGAVRDL